MTYHIFNGDALAEKFPAEQIEGTQIVIREAFIEGPVTADFSKMYWKKRSAFVSKIYGADSEEYDVQFLSQLEQIHKIQNTDEVNLWFEDDLFCQTNMWFAVYYISLTSKPEFYRVFPDEDKLHWSGFGRAGTKDLTGYFKRRIRLNENEVEFSKSLWIAYASNNRIELKSLSSVVSKGFRFLQEVISAHLDRSPDDGRIGRPQQSLIEILKEEKTNFYEICDSFWERNSIYGFGDLQVLNMLKEMEIEFSEE